MGSLGYASSQLRQVSSVHCCWGVILERLRSLALECFPAFGQSHTTSYPFLVLFKPQIIFMIINNIFLLTHFFKLKLILKDRLL